LRRAALQVCTGSKPMTNRFLFPIATLALVAPVTHADEGVETIVVSGERTLDDKPDVGSRLGLTNRETPAIVDVISQGDLQLQGARSLIEALNTAPGVASGNLPGSVASVSMRGFHRAVNYLYDGVRQPNSDAGMRNWDAWNFERIEVIKGPASITSGEGALAGAINFVPRTPKLDETSGELLASYGSHGRLRLAADANVPVRDTVALRGDVSYSRSNGWVDDTDAEAWSGRLAALIEPSDRLTIKLSADLSGDDFSTAY
jgi:iron complex outermembrane receptor protein